MKNNLHSYITFTRTERIGLISLSTLLLLLITIKATMHLWVHQVIDAAQQQKLVAAWQTFKNSQPARTEQGSILQKKEFQDASDEQTTALPDTINLNTADSATLVRLKGIGPVTAHNIIKRRTARKFTNIDELRETGSFSQTTLQLLKKHILF